MVLYKNLEYSFFHIILQLPLLDSSFADLAFSYPLSQELQSLLSQSLQPVVSAPPTSRSNNSSDINEDANIDNDDIDGNYTAPCCSVCSKPELDFDDISYPPPRTISHKSNLSYTLKSVYIHFYDLYAHIQFSIFL